VGRQGKPNNEGVAKKLRKHSQGLSPTQPPFVTSMPHTQQEGLSEVSLNRIHAATVEKERAFLTRPIQFSQSMHAITSEVTPKVR
jgi:hypothetical protein